MKLLTVAMTVGIMFPLLGRAAVDCFICTINALPLQQCVTAYFEKRGNCQPVAPYNACGSQRYGCCLWKSCNCGKCPGWTTPTFRYFQQVPSCRPHVYNVPNCGNVATTANTCTIRKSNTCRSSFPDYLQKKYDSTADELEKMSLYFAVAGSIPVIGDGFELISASLAIAANKAGPTPSSVFNELMGNMNTLRNDVLSCFEDNQANYVNTQAFIKLDKVKKIIQGALQNRGSSTRQTDYWSPGFTMCLDMTVDFQTASRTLNIQRHTEVLQFAPKILEVCLLNFLGEVGDLSKKDRTAANLRSKLWKYKNLIIEDLMRATRDTTNKLQEAWNRGCGAAPAYKNIADKKVRDLRSTLIPAMERLERRFYYAECKRTNVALLRPAYQSSTVSNSNPVSYTTDRSGSRTCSQTRKGDFVSNAYFYVDLGRRVTICNVVIHVGNNAAPFGDFDVFVTDQTVNGFYAPSSSEICSTLSWTRPRNGETAISCKKEIAGRRVGIRPRGKSGLQICDFRVYELTKSRPVSGAFSSPQLLLNQTKTCLKKGNTFKDKYGHSCSWYTQHGICSAGKIRDYYVTMGIHLGKKDGNVLGCCAKECALPRANPGSNVTLVFNVEVISNVNIEETERLTILSLQDIWRENVTVYFPVAAVELTKDVYLVTIGMRRTPTDSGRLTDIHNRSNDDVFVIVLAESVKKLSPIHNPGANLTFIQTTTMFSESAEARGVDIPKQKTDNKLLIGSIVGGACGVLCLLCVCCGMVSYRRKMTQHVSNEDQTYRLLDH